MVIGLISQNGSVRKSFNTVLLILNSTSVHKRFNEKKYRENLILSKNIL